MYLIRLLKRLLGPSAIPDLLVPVPDCVPISMSATLTFFHNCLISIEGFIIVLFFSSSFLMFFSFVAIAMSIIYTCFFVNYSHGLAYYGLNGYYLYYYYYYGIPELYLKKNKTSYLIKLLSISKKLNYNSNCNIPLRDSLV